MRRIAAAALAVLGLFVFAAPSSAQKYPSRNVTIIVPYPAGGPTDQAARQIGQLLSKKLGQNFVVENVTGGSTIIATNKTAKATPDGYTLLVHNLQIAANVSLFKDLPFNTEKDITSVGLINKNPLVLVGRPGLAPNSLKELIDLAKKDRLKEALPGFGTTGHLTSALLMQEAKLKFDQIPYRGAAPAMTDLLGDHVDVFIGTPQSILAYVKAGKLKAYGITSKEKSELLPQADSIPALLGPQFDIIYWQGMFAPAGTPPEVIKTLNAALQEAVEDPALNKIWAAEGVSPFPKDQRSVAAATAFFKSEVARWGKIIRDNDIKVKQ
ncbi:MAG TPA: tripartite tricarboxylate transporter substrate-binding protein [Pseudolabrys sp.]|nr:tripartite tricarboxylate transporter substrate-binding protein [Pseudolabrys sp.]